MSLLYEYLYLLSTTGLKCGFFTTIDKFLELSLNQNYSVISQRYDKGLKAKASLSLSFNFLSLILWDISLDAGAIRHPNQDVESEC